LVTTAKDAVKLRSLSFSMPWHVFEIEIKIENENALADLIRAVLVEGRVGVGPCWWRAGLV
jgi:tetraacyldisaccharide-1-P 4'-kinase